MEQKQKSWKTLLFYLLLAGCLGVFAVMRGTALSSGIFTAQGWCAVAILVFAISGWMLELAPLAVTALWVLVLTPLSGLMTFSDAVKSSFGSSIFAFFLGVLMLSAAFRQTTLGEQMTAGLFTLLGKRPRAVMLGVMAAGAFLAMWVTEVAAAAILFPITMSIAEQAQGRTDAALLRRNFMLSVAWGCAFGGVATPIATGANMIAVQHLQEYGGISIGFGEWMAIGVPICISLLLAGWLLLAFPIKDNTPLAVKAQRPPFTGREKKLLVVFLISIALWIFGERIGLSSHWVALTAAAVLCCPGVAVLDWKQTVREISWDSILLICAGVLLGDLLHSYGVAQQMANLLFSKSLLQTGAFFSALYIVLAVSVLKVVFSSNTVSGVIMVPIMISLATGLGVPAWGLVAPCIFSTALSLLVITSSPVNVIPYASGYFTPTDFLRAGWKMTLVSAVVIAIWLMVFGVASV